MPLIATASIQPLGAHLSLVAISHDTYPSFKVSLDVAKIQVSILIQL